MKKSLLIWVCLVLVTLLGEAQIVENSSRANAQKKFPNQSSWELLTKDKILERNLPYNLPNSTRKSYQLPVSIPQNVGEDNSIAYGYLAFDYRFRARGIVALSTGDPNGIEMVNRYGAGAGDPAICAGTMVGDDYWAYLYIYYDMGTFIPVGLGTIDLASGEFTTVFDYQNMDYLFAHMTYDVKNDILWAIRLTSQSMDFYSIDTASGIPVLKGSSDRYFFCIAADDDGNMYGIGEEGKLYKIDTNDFSSALIGDTKERPAYSQSMTFDHTTHTLWWSGSSETSGWFCSVDVKTAKVSNRQVFDNEAQIVGLAIPYQKVNDEAPSYVRNLKIINEDGGSLKATLSWTNPTTNYRKQPLNELTRVEIYRNDQLVYTYETTELGKEISWTDEVAGSGYYDYKLVPVNKSGKGLYKTMKKFVGEDAPGAVGNLNLTASGTKGTLTWTSPTRGANNGWFDVSGLKYKIYRMPGHTLVGDTDATTYTDEVTELGGYNYIVQAYNKIGTGPEVISNKVVFGPPPGLPFANGFENQYNMDKMTIIDANSDRNTWEYASFEQFVYYEANRSQANDFLITPSLALKAGKIYQAECTYQSASSVDYFESLKIVAGKEPRPEKMNIEIADFPKITGGVIETGAGTFTVSEDGNYFVGFQCYSEPGQWRLMLHRILVKEVLPNDLAAISILGPKRPACKEEHKYQVRVVNKGSNAQENFIVRLIDGATNAVLAESVCNERIAGGDSITVSVPWTPEQEGVISLKASTVLNADEDASNDTTPEAFMIEVFSEGSPEWIKIGEAVNTSMFCPFNMLYETSVSQTIYYADELNISSGTLIKGIEYEYGSAWDEIDTEVELYIMNTTVSELEGFIGKPEDFEKVFTGTLVMPKSKNTAMFMFEKDFVYTGGNICVMGIRPFDIAYPLGSFSIFEDEVHPNRCWCYYHDKVEYSFTGNEDSSPRYRNSPYTPVTSFGIRSIPEGIANNTEANCQLIQYKDRIQFSKECSSVKIVDITGKVYSSYHNTDCINIQSLPKGVYIIEFICDNQINKEKALVW